MKKNLRKKKIATRMRASLVRALRKDPTKAPTVGNQPSQANPVAKLQAVKPVRKVRRLKLMLLLRRLRRRVKVLQSHQALQSRTPKSPRNRFRSVSMLPQTKTRAPAKYRHHRQRRQRRRNLAGLQPSRSLHHLRQRQLAHRVTLA
jgi:hypothetical protein